MQTNAIDWYSESKLIDSARRSLSRKPELNPLLLHSHAFVSLGTLYIVGMGAWTRPAKGFTVTEWDALASYLASRITTPNFS